MSVQFHEDLARASVEPRASERSFGLVFAAVFALLALWPLVNGRGARWWAFGVAGLFLALAFVAPVLLRPLNRLWMALGRLLNRIVSPVVMAFLYIVAVVPTGLALRLSGKDPLRLRRDPGAASYWLPRQPPGPPPDSFKNQF
jgi:predicted membrane metal-binding protein